MWVVVASKKWCDNWGQSRRTVLIIILSFSIWLFKRRYSMNSHPLFTCKPFQITRDLSWILFKKEILWRNIVSGLHGQISKGASTKSTFTWKDLRRCSWRFYERGTVTDCLSYHTNLITLRKLLVEIIPRSDSDLTTETRTWMRHDALLHWVGLFIV